MILALLEIFFVGVIVGRLTCAFFIGIHLIKKENWGSKSKERVKIKIKERIKSSFKTRLIKE